MSKFSVIVFGDNVEQSLEPWNENNNLYYVHRNDTEEYLKQVKENGKDEARKYFLGDLKFYQKIYLNKFPKFPPQTTFGIVNNQNEIIRIFSYVHPNPKWDYWITGFNKEGYFKLNEKGIQKHGKDSVDSCLKSEIKDITDILPFAAVYNNKWYALGDMGWFGSITKYNKNWENEFLELIQSVPEDTRLTYAYCHI